MGMIQALIDGKASSEHHSRRWFESIHLHMGSLVSLDNPGNRDKGRIDTAQRVSVVGVFNFG